MLSTITWTLPRPAKSKYKGAFPLYFEANLLQLLGWPEKVLHPFGSMAEYGTRVDINPDVHPDVLGDAHAPLPRCVVRLHDPRPPRTRTGRQRSCTGHRRSI
jgi:hypothetical protein